MATATKRAVMRNVEKKSNTRKTKDVPTQATIRADFKTFLAKDVEKDMAKAVLRRHILQLTIADPVLAQEWQRQWDMYKSTEVSKAAQASRANAKTYFVDWFGIATSSDAKSQVAKSARTATARMVEIVQEAVAVYRMKYGDGFDFADDGSTYLKRGTTLAEDMWVYMEYEKNDDLKGNEYAKRNPSVIIKARADQVFQGQVSWIDVRGLLLDKTGQTATSGTRGAAIDAGKTPLAAMHLMANTAEANKKLYETNTQKLHALTYIEEILRKAAMVGPLFSEGWESVDKGFALWRAKLGKVTVTPKDAASLATKSGSEVIDMFKRKGDVATPETAKSLPHPNGPKAAASKK